MYKQLDDITKIPLIPALQYSHDDSVYVEQKWYYSLKEAYKEIYFYHLLEKHCIVPRLIDSCIKQYKVYWNRVEDYLPDYYYVTCLIIENGGESLSRHYFNECERDEYEGPGTYTEEFLKSSDLQEECFPSHKVPSNVMSQIIHIIKISADLGYSIDDIHAGNFVIDHHGIVRMIDLELLSKIK